MDKDNIIELLELTRGEQASLQENGNDEFHIYIKNNGENNINICGIKYFLSMDEINDIFKAFNENYEQFKLMYENQDNEGMLGGTITTMTLKTKKEEIKIYDNILNDDYKNKFDGFVNLLINEIKDQNVKVVSKNNNMKKLKRTELADEFYGYHSRNNIINYKDVCNYLDIIDRYLNKFNYDGDDDYILCGRKKIIYDEAFDIINSKKTVENPIWFLLGSLEEFMCNNNFIYSSEDDYNNRKKNDNYIKKGYICLEEKENIKEILLAIRNYNNRESEKNNTNDEKNNDLNLHKINTVLDERLTKIVQDVVGNNDPYWTETIKKVVTQIMEMEEGTENSISNLLGEDIQKFTSKQLFDIDKLVSEVCSQFKIKLDRSNYKDQVVGLPYNIPFIKK